jgi:hypothetical protein
MVHLVVLDQLTRTDNAVPTMERLVSITDARAPLPLPVHTLALLLAGTLVGAAALVAWRLPVSRPSVTLLAVQGAVLLQTPAYFAHYATFVAPAIALVAGAAAGLVVARAGQHVRAALPVMAVATVAALALAGVSSQLRTEGRPAPAAAVRASLADARCVSGDTPAALIATDVLARDLRRGCPLIVDVTGTTYNQDPGDLAEGRTRAARRHDGEWQQQITAYLRAADAVLMQRQNPSGLAAHTLASLARGRQVRRWKQFVVFLRPHLPLPGE